MAQTGREIHYNAPSLGVWTIPSEEGDTRLAQDLLLAMTQEALAKYTSPHGFGALSMKGYFGRVLKPVFDLRATDKEASNIRKFLREAMRQTYPNTLTRIAYMSEGKKDLIIHDYGTPKQTETEVDFVGSDGEIVSNLSLDACLALTGRSPEEVRDIMKWINGTSAWVWRVNSKPRQRDERVAGFYASSGRADLDCSRRTGNSYPSLGVI
ncbi:MAG: hypothetical protein NT076_03655 [Candidatus Pacearchaeota archaeon]|nr:hypothetical protein [Candidatus Pacearchaeota archaeon]